MSKTIAITGASGFIGSYLKNFFRRKGFTVIALQRQVDAQDHNMRSFDLGQDETVSENLFKNVDIFIHCAFVKKSGEKQVDINFNGTKALLDAARKAEVKKSIFFSTTSAHEENGSFYGKSKRNIEKLFKEEKDVVLKCGLVIGDGGLFKQMLSYVLSRNIVPLLNGGRQAVQFVSIDSVATAINNILELDIKGTFVLAQPKAITYKQLFLTIKKHFNTRLIFLPIPFFLLNGILFITENLNIGFPVTKENLLGLKAMRALENKIDAKKLGLPEEKFEDLLERYYPVIT